MYVCFCAAVTDRTINEAIASGATTVDDVAQRCEAGARCGGCREQIAGLLRANERQTSTDPALV